MTRFSATFARVDLACMSVERAACFYRDAFGWTFEPPTWDLPGAGSLVAAAGGVGARGTSLLFAGRGLPDSAGWLELTPEVGLVEVPRVPPPGGTVAVVGVDSIDGALARIERAGGTCVSGLDVIDDNWTAVFADSEGTHIGLWSPGPDVEFSWKPHVGASVVNGAKFQYIELQALSLQRASRFYADVFGWQFVGPHVSHAPGGPFPAAHGALYGDGVIVYCDDLRPEVGLRKVEKTQVPGSIAIAVGVDSISAALRRTVDAGGVVQREVVHGADVSLAVIADTEQNVLALIAPSPGRQFAWTPHVMMVEAGE